MNVEPAVAFVLLLLALVGHFLLWAGLVNRLHATGLPRRINRPLTLLIFLLTILLPAGFVAWARAVGDALDRAGQWLGALARLACYLAACWIAAAAGAAVWLRRRWFARPGRLLRSVRNRLHRPLELTVQSVPEDHVHHVLTRLPGDQMLWLDVAEVAVEIPRLPAELDGLKVVTPIRSAPDGPDRQGVFPGNRSPKEPARARRSGNHRRRDGSGRLPAVDPGGLHRPAGARRRLLRAGQPRSLRRQRCPRRSLPRPAW